MPEKPAFGFIWLPLASVEAQGTGSPQGGLFPDLPGIIRPTPTLPTLPTSSAFGKAFGGGPFKAIKGS